MPKNTTEDERKETVEDVITSMGLISCRCSRIGSSTEKSISRSERKRLAFASEVNSTCAVYRSTTTMQLDRLIYPATVP
ncbi:hypothetical protein KIN20_033451 [Parelaphostrongylus tenuis]|uniref:Uncharacterized protein n=1 Tax=Parelaphostrongylus tenuis TaxID=148309 RepID=A0AAD5R849_PARTN|nr:hypothetical protein KIN20_033451 [Parelaphostrongylus tenuis]